MEKASVLRETRVFLAREATKSAKVAVVRHETTTRRKTFPTEARNGAC